MTTETKKWIGGFTVGLLSAWATMGIVELVKFLIWGQAFIQANL